MKKLLVIMSIALMSVGSAMAMSSDGDGSRENSYITHMGVAHPHASRSSVSDFRYKGRTAFGDGSVENSYQSNQHHSTHLKGDRPMLMNEMHYGDGSPTE